MADFFFFTDSDKLASDTTNTAFGEISSSQYRFTDTHQATSGPINAYAVCNGRVFVQEISGTLVNLILKPDIQPIGTNPNVKFYIYRNILKNSLISGTTVASNTNKLTRSIEDKITSLGSINDKKVLGVGLTGADFLNNNPIDNAFYKQGVADSSFQLWSVSGGWSIGQFQGSSFGFEIMLDSVGFNPELSLVRSVGDNIFTAATLPGSPSPVDLFNEQMDREMILNYIDPCAFFANFIKGNNRLFLNNASNPAITDSTFFTILPQNLIYSSLITPFFKNKNYLYVDIRNELNDSYDYQWNYGVLSGSSYMRPDLQISYSGTGSLTGKNYYGTNKWPLWVIDVSNSTFGNSSPFIDKHILRIVFPSGNNKLPLLNVCNGYPDDNSNSFPAAPRDDSRFIHLTVLGGNTDLISLSIPRDASGFATSGYIHLKYIRQQEQLVFDPITDVATVPDTVNGTALYGLEVLDNIFTPFVVDKLSNTTILENMSVPWKSALDNIQSNIYFDKHFIDQSRYTGCALSAYRGIGINVAGDRTLFAIATDKDGFNDSIPDASFPKNANSNKEILSGESYLESLVRNNSEIFTYQKYDLLLGPTVSVEVIDNQKIDNKLFAGNAGELISIKLSNAEWTSIKTTAQSQGFLKGSKLYLGLKYSSNGIIPANIFDGATLTETKNVAYVKFEVVLRGYVIDSTASPNIPKLKEVSSLNGGLSIFHYSILPGFDLATEAPTIGDNARGKTHNIFENFGISSSVFSSEMVIECKLNIARGAFISPDEFRLYFEHFRENIRQIWTTNNPTDHPTIQYMNKGTAAVNHKLYRPDLVTWPISISAYPASYIDTGSQTQSSNGIEFKLATAKHFGSLQSTEIIVNVDRKSNPRSFTLGNRRGMSMSFENQPIGNDHYEDITADNVPAHEFGHVLGLADRYAYLGLANIPVSNISASALSQSQISGLFDMNPNYGRSPYLYLPESYDIDYATRYSWMHNLMSSQRRTPTLAEITVYGTGLPNHDDGQQIYWEQDYRTEYSTADLVSEIPDGRTPVLYKKVGVFITQAQWNIVASNADEEEDHKDLFRFSNHVFIKAVTTSNYPGTVDKFRGSFVGKDTYLLPSTVNDSLMTDDDYLYFVDLPNPTLSINGSMKWRLRKWAPSSAISSPLLSNENISSLRAHIGPLDDSIGAPPNIGGSGFGYSDNALLFRQQLERGDVGGGAINDAINERRKFFIDRLNVLTKPILADDFKVRRIGGSLPNVTLEPADSTIIHVLNRRDFQLGPGVTGQDDFETFCSTGGTKIKLPSHPAEITSYLPDVVPTNIPTQEEIVDAGRLVWNHYFRVSGSNLEYNKYTAGSSKIWAESPIKYPKFPTAAGLPLPTKYYTVKWDIYDNRNIILYIIEYARLDFPSNTGAAFFRNHDSLTYQPVTLTGFY